MTHDKQNCKEDFEREFSELKDRVISFIQKSKQEEIKVEMDRLRIPKEYEIEGNHYGGYDYEFAIGYNEALVDVKAIINNLA